MGGGGREGKESKETNKTSKIQRKLQNKSKCKSNTCFSWVFAVSVLSLTGSHSQPYLPKMSFGLWWSLLLLWGQLRLSSGPTPVCSCLQCPLSELVHFLSWECTMSFYIFHRYQVCLYDRVDLICSSYTWCMSMKVPQLLRSTPNCNTKCAGTWTAFF